MNKLVRKIAGLVAPLAVGAGLAAGVSVMPAPAAHAATVQFTATIQAPNRILTSQPLSVNEKITVGLDGFKETVTAVQDNGGGTIAWLQFALPSTVHVGSVVVFTAH